MAKRQNNAQAVTGLVFAILLITFSACQPQDGKKVFQPVQESDVAVTIGSEQITRQMLEKEFERHRAFLDLKESGDSTDNIRLKKFILFKLIDETLMDMEAKKRGITISKEELDEEMKALLGEYEKTRLGLELSNSGIDFDQWKKDVERGLRIKKLVASEIDSKIKINAKQTSDYFKQNRDQFAWPERVMVLQIMVNDETKAEQIRKALLRKGDFAKIAKESSLSPDAVNGGDLGFFSRGQLPPEFEDAVFDLKKGQISQVVESIYGFHIFKVAKREKSRQMTYSEAKAGILKLLLEKEREKEFKKWVARIKEKTPIKLNNDLLARISL